MGLFSGKKKTYRDFSYSRLIEDDYLPDVMGQAVTTYVLDKDNTKSLADLMLEYGWSANNVKWDAAYRWAKKPGKYLYGVPEVSAVAVSDFTGAESLDEVLQSLTGQPNLDYVYSKFLPGNFRHGMWQRLVSTQGYSATTNILGTLTASLGTTCWLYNATNYLTAATVEAVDAPMLEHWGYSPTSGATFARTQDLSRSDTPDATSLTGSNYVRVEYTCSFAGVSRIHTEEVTTVTTTVRTPNEEGGYDDVTTEETSSTETDTTDWNGVTLPNDTITATDVLVSTDERDENDPDETSEETDPVTGVVTIVVTSVVRHITTRNVSISVVAFFNMTFGSFDYNPSSEDIDTETVLDDEDSGNYDPNAPLIPSGEDTDTDPDLFMVCYQWVSGATTHIGYFTYEYGSGSYPALDGIAGTQVADFGQHFPRLYFRADGTKLAQESKEDTEEYKTSKRLGNKLDMSWLQVSDQLYESMSSLDKIRDILMIQMVPANTENVIEQEYLYNYFKTLCLLRPEYTQDLWTMVSSETPGSGTVPPSDLDTFELHQGCLIKSTDTKIDTYNNMSILGFATITGSIGSKGTATSGYAEDGVIPVFINKNTYGTQTKTYHYYQYQISDTQYEEVRVYELDHSVRVGGKNVTRGHEHEYLMVPLDHAFRKLFSTHERETLYARAAQILICTEYTVKTKWYQTGIFKAVIVVIAVVLSWWTGGASMTLVGVLTAVATAVGTMIAFSLLTKYVFSRLGSWASILVTVVAVVAAIYSGYLYVSGTTGPFNVTAQTMMQVSNVAFQATDAAQKGQMIQVAKKLEALEQQIEAGADALEAAQDELNQGSNTINDWVLLQASQGFVNLGETPDQMIARTLNTNIGVIALQLPDMYLAQGLALPSDTEIMQMIQKSLYTVPDDELNPLM